MRIPKLSTKKYYFLNMYCSSLWRSAYNLFNLLLLFIKII